jgi:two-component system cell cycle response regulator
MNTPDEERAAARVLFVDDEPMIRSAFRRLMTRTGISADVAASGAEALALARHHPYSVVVTDLSMPGMSGQALIRHLRVGQKDATYIAVTGLPRLDPEYEQILQDDSLTVVHKPWDDGRLTGVIRAALDAPPMTERAISLMPTSVRGEPVLRVLLLEDNPGDAELFEDALCIATRSSCKVERASTLSDAVRRLETGRFDIAVADLTLPDARDLEAVHALQSVAPAVPLVVLTGVDDEIIALRAVQAGAQDYLIKGQTDCQLMKRTIRYSIERKRAEQRLVQLAHYDQLTGLVNRSLFRQRVASALARARRGGRFSVMVLDLDRFKFVNDAMGHEAGDILLQKVAAALTRAVREGDTVARLGGDEFAILLEAIDDPDEIGAIAERILGLVAEPQDLGEGVVATTVSIGVAIYPEGGDCTDVLLKVADRAMYAAKAAGRSAYRIAAASQPAVVNP